MPDQRWQTLETSTQDVCLQQGRSCAWHMSEGASGLSPRRRIAVYAPETPDTVDHPREKSTEQAGVSRSHLLLIHENPRVERLKDWGADDVHTAAAFVSLPQRGSQAAPRYPWRSTED